MPGSLLKNRSVLLSHGSGDLRRDAVDILSAAISRTIPYQKTLDLIACDEDGVHIGEQFFPFSSLRRIFVVGSGKGSFPIAQAVEERLGSRITEGFVAVKEGEHRRLPHIEVFESSHPLPDERSLLAAGRIRDLLARAEKGDLVLILATGGTSALINLPPAGISIADIRKMNDLLLRSGGDIGMMNTVRRHLCGLKGGNLARLCLPASFITLTLDTSPPNTPWPDVSLPDPTTFSDAIAVLKRFSIWEETPVSIRSYFTKGLSHPEWETVKDPALIAHPIYSVADPPSTCEAAAKAAAELGYTPHILSTKIEGEAKDAGIFLSGIANEIYRNGRPFSPPCALISGGETTVSISGESGLGGPNQETVLGFALKLGPEVQAVIASMDTDGTDGPCDSAGGIADRLTLPRARELGIDLLSVLRRHDAYPALEKLEDHLFTGHTGTNVMNLRVVLIGGKQPYEENC